MKEIKPIIWRRIQVPENYTFWDFHVAIQDSMGWLDYHLHLFRTHEKHTRNIVEIGLPDNSGWNDPIKPSWEIAISNYFSDLGTVADYDYDFGDNWRHKILLEGYFLKEKGVKYPRCIEGKRACPPEDCGGVDGYYNILEIMNNPNHEEYEGIMTWLDPDSFIPGKVKFANPKKRLKKGLG